jgi:hypothetical protein
MRVSIGIVVQQEMAAVVAMILQRYVCMTDSCCGDDSGMLTGMKRQQLW